MEALYKIAFIDQVGFKSFLGGVHMTIELRSSRAQLSWA
jgi:hypothetical protein